MHAIVVANGELPSNGDLAGVRDALVACDLLIAADGGLEHCARLNVWPALVVGDMDSATAESIAQAERQGASVQRHPSDKNATDLELGLEAACDRGADRVTVIAAFGGRLDHALATVAMLGSELTAGVELDAWDGRRRLWVLRERLELALRIGQVVSIVPLGGAVTGLTTSGMQWELADDTLDFGSTRGVSNVVVASKQTITSTSGVAAVVVDLED